MTGSSLRNASCVGHRHGNQELSAAMSVGTRPSLVRPTYRDEVGVHGAPQILGEEEEQYNSCVPTGEPTRLYWMFPNP